MSLSTDERVDTTLNIDTGDHDRFAHYFRKDDLEKAFFYGEPITALCGKQDIPTRDFTKYPVCPTCQEVFNQLPAGE